MKADGAAVKLPEPRLRDGQAAEAQRAALREVAGSDQRLEEMVRNSVTAPYIIKVRDVKAGDATIRVVDLWFVVYADLAEVDPAREAAKADDKEVEAGNMVMRTRLLKPEELRAAGIARAIGIAGVGAGDLVRPHPRPAARSDRVRRDEPGGGDPDDRLDRRRRRGPTRRSTSRGRSPTAGGRSGRPGEEGGRRTSKPYQGGISYTKISRLAFQPGALLVEMHAAFVEPHDWFQGAPILRSKFSVVAQDQIRRLRRELERRRPS